LLPLPHKSSVGWPSKIRRQNLQPKLPACRRAIASTIAANSIKRPCPHGILGEQEMADNVDHTAKNIADQRGPYAAPLVTGISPIVRADLAKLGNETRQRVLDVVKRKNS
jgi:hypothetical protein